jgi:hypothetical protein
MASRKNVILRSPRSRRLEVRTTVHLMLRRARGDGTMLRQLFDAYPTMFILTIAVPLVGGLGTGVIASWVGYESLKRQLSSAQQTQRIEEGIKTLGSNSSALTTTLDVLKSYNDKITAAGRRDAVLVALINQYQQLSRAAALFGQMTRTDPSGDQGKVAAEILKILNQDVVHALPRNDLPGHPLVIELAPNSFRVIYPVPMRTAPELTFTGLPEGVSAVVSDKSEMSFAVSFLPTSTPVKTFGVVASADL